MTLRTRTLAFSAVLVLLPLLGLGALARLETSKRLSGEYLRRVESLAAVIDEQLAARSRDVAARLDAWKLVLRDDNRLRRALGGDPAERNHLLDASGRAMSLTGLDLLQLQDENGKIVSSGHYRNEFDRVDRGILDWLASLGDRPGLVEARRGEGSFLALARADSLRLGGRLFHVVGGWEVDRAALASLSPDPELPVSLVHPGGALSTDPSIEASLAEDPRSLARSSREFLVRARELAARGAAEPAGMPAPSGAPAPSGTPAPSEAPDPDPSRPDTARFLVSHSLAPRDAILRALDLRLGLAILLVAAGSGILAVRLSRGITRPVEELAAKTARLDLDRLDESFATDRDDEIGTLSRFLDAMTKRLSASVARLRDAERRATLGELARQVNHDLRNAFTPLRNVVTHLSEVADDSPQDLVRVYREREGTLRSGLAYLDDLATNWKRLATAPERTACDLGRIVREVASGRRPEEGGPVHVSIADDVAPVRADPVGLRRVVENLVANACDAVGKTEVGTTEAGAPGGRVDLILRAVPPEASAIADGGRVELVVRDDGPGIPAKDLDRIFDHFYTTKETGGGLGLSIVRRLVSDFEGSIDVRAGRERGTEFRVSMPAARPVGEARTK